MSRDLATGEIEFLVLFLVDKIRRGGPDDVTPELIVALRDRIFGDVENRPVVGRPREVVHTLDSVRQRFTRAEILDPQE